MKFKGTITPATPGDLDALAAIEQACFSRPWSRESLAAMLLDPHSLLLAARLAPQGEIVGYGGLELVLDEGHIANLAVLPQHQRQGIGRELLAAMVAKGKSRNLAFLTLEVREANLAALALYTAMGFVQVGRRPGYYQAPREAALLLTYHYPKG